MMTVDLYKLSRCGSSGKAVAEDGHEHRQIRAQAVPTAKVVTTRTLLADPPQTRKTKATQNLPYIR